MNYNIITIGGGIMSLLHVAIENLLEFVINNPNTEIKQYRIIINNNHAFVNKHLFDDYFLIENDSTSNSNSNNNTIQSEAIWKCIYRKLPESPYLNIVKKIIRINKIKPEILEQVELYRNIFQINENTLSIHIRLTDMNIIHPEFGIRNFDHYKSKIDEILERHNNIDNLFICSDNNESINKIAKLYGDKYKINFILDSYREEFEVVPHDIGHLNYFNRVNTINDFHIKLFIEILTASKGKYFIGRSSDVSNFIVAFSDTITDIYYIN